MENKIYLENGEIIDLDNCFVCKKVFHYSETKTEDVDPEKTPKASIAGVMFDKFGKDLVSVQKIRTCDCGSYPDITIRVKE